MAYIKERGNNNYFVRVSCGTLDNGRPFQKSRLFRPSRVNLPESKVRKELDAFVKALEEECRIEFETKRQPQTNFELSEDETKHESVEEQVKSDHQSMITPINSSSTPLFADFCTIYLAAKRRTFRPPPICFMKPRFNEFSFPGSVIFIWMRLNRIMFRS